MNFNPIKNQMSNLLSLLSTSTSLDYAVFDSQATLVASTEPYLLRKGKTVHTTSIEEVLEQGNVIVNKPGHMASCIGCRFANNCPSTIELLSCIKIDNISVGVISLTSFTTKGHNLISRDIKKYVDIIEQISNVIANLLQTPTSPASNDFSHIALDSVLDEVDSNCMIIDNAGNIVYLEESVHKMFAYCNFYTQSIYQLLPGNISAWIISTSFPSEQFFSTNYFTGTISKKPLYRDSDLIGFLLKFEEIRVSSDNSKSSSLDSIISEDENIKEIKKLIMKIASSPSTVLITGSTGTGKEMVAKAIHDLSNRKDYPMVSINCANIPENLFESELFGYEDGTFTGAKKGGKTGIFEKANGGTIFLDEIGELPQGLQAKLLRVLQESTIQRIGSIKSIPVDVRIIAATNKNLETMIKEGSFREDLYYRINIIPIHIPSLQERFQDLEPLTHHFVEKYNKKLNKHIRTVSSEAFTILKSYSWPGNIRELENSVEYAMNIAEGDTIKDYHLPKRIHTDTIETKNMKNLTTKTEVELILDALDKNGWDTKGKEKSAEQLGISVRTLYRKLKESVPN